MSIELDGANILITGGTGSFGQQFVQTILDKYSPRRIAVFSRDEDKQYEMSFRFPVDRGSPIRYLIGDVRDISRLEMAMRDVDIVVHAAAMKHVPAAEYNPFECIHTNVHGAENVVQAALRTGVKRVVALSTDKAANPINLYGASKLAADKIFVAANHLRGGQDTSFSVVRYGNVLGSRGSVVPLFRRMLAEGRKSLPITDPRMTRFFITLSGGVEFLLASLQRMSGGEIFTPKIPSARVVDVAAAMAPGFPIEEIGIRPGEKLHEVLITTDDARTTVELEDSFIIEPAIHLYHRESLAETGGKPVEDGFHYASDTNHHFLDVEDLRSLLDAQGLLPGR